VFLLLGFAFWVQFYAVSRGGGFYDELTPLLFAIPVLLGVTSILLLLAEPGLWRGARWHGALVLTFAGLLVTSPAVADDGREVACIYGLWPDPSICSMLHPFQRDLNYVFFPQRQNGPVFLPPPQNGPACDQVSCAR
jgi:hypothetical protein